MKNKTTQALTVSTTNKLASQAQQTRFPDGGRKCLLILADSSKMEDWVLVLQEHT